MSVTNYGIAVHLWPQGPDQNLLLVSCNEWSGGLCISSHPIHSAYVEGTLQPIDGQKQLAWAADLTDLVLQVLATQLKAPGVKPVFEGLPPRF